MANHDGNLFIGSFTNSFHFQFNIFLIIISRHPDEWDRTSHLSGKSHWMLEKLYSCPGISYISSVYFSGHGSPPAIAVKIITKEIKLQTCSEWSLYIKRFDFEGQVLKCFLSFRAALSQVKESLTIVRYSDELRDILTTVLIVSNSARSFPGGRCAEHSTSEKARQPHL